MYSVCMYVISKSICKYTYALRRVLWQVQLCSKTGKLIDLRSALVRTGNPRSVTTSCWLTNRISLAATLAETGLPPTNTVQTSSKASTPLPPTPETRWTLTQTASLRSRRFSSPFLPLRWRSCCLRKKSQQQPIYLPPQLLQLRNTYTSVKRMNVIEDSCCSSSPEFLDILRLMTIQNT